MVLSNKHADNTVITLLPNRSATWVETRLLLFVLCGTTLAIGIFWASMGAWVILPFCGLETALLAFVMYRASQATYQRQVITCSPRRIMVQFGTHFPKRSWILERERTHLAVLEPAHHLDTLKLNIFDASHSIELGNFLNKEDKEEALKALKGAGLYVRSFNQESSSFL